MGSLEVKPPNANKLLAKINGSGELSLMFAWEAARRVDQLTGDGRFRNPKHHTREQFAAVTYPELTGIMARLIQDVFFKNEGDGTDFSVPAMEKQGTPE